VFEAAIDPAERDARQAALVIATLCIGGMVIARAIEDDDLAGEIREAARVLALEVAGLGAAAPLSAAASSD
jgi:TetR/AcrR family transcriptional repressor of nem operon